MKTEVLFAKRSTFREKESFSYLRGTAINGLIRPSFDSTETIRLKYMYGPCTRICRFCFLFFIYFFFYLFIYFF